MNQIKIEPRCQVQNSRTQSLHKKTYGCLIVNLGTPKSPGLVDVFHYLNEFLTDGRVIDLPWFQRQLLVRGGIVPLRFRQSAEQYRKLWTEQGSPLLVHGKAVRDKVQERLGDNFKVILAMRYQEPSINLALEQLRIEGVDELIVVPMFPQYASATTGSVHQKVMEVIARWQIIPHVTFISHYFDHPAFIHAFSNRIKSSLAEKHDHLLLSFHGLPEKMIRRDDSSGKCLKGGCCEEITKVNRFCYRAQCFGTARAIANELNLSEKDYSICFQSRLGRDPWLQPYTSDMLRSCIEKGYQNVLVACPSFVCDCLETTCEISHEYGDEFKKLGGKELKLIEGLNSDPLWIDALCQIIQQG
jgi:protoporphyrin/coproporphyrin ferrochelatase